MQATAALVNAFTLDGHGGNPAGVVLQASDLTDSQMQLIAEEVGASETAFLLPSPEATYRIRFFTPTTEVDLCGHATIASWSLLLQTALRRPGKYTQSTLAGLINIELSEDGQVFMEQPEQPMGNTIKQDLICAALNISKGSLDTTFEPRTVRGNLMVALRSIEQLQQLRPSMQTMTQVSNEQGFHSFHVFVYSGEAELLATVRDFCPAIGIPEDPATGTANGSLVAYLQNADRLPRQDSYIIKQGEAMGKPSQIIAELKNNRIWVGGYASFIKRFDIALS